MKDAENGGNDNYSLQIEGVEKYLDVRFPIKKGTKNKEVLTIQNALGITGENKTGIMDDNTVSVLKKLTGKAEISNEKELSELISDNFYSKIKNENDRYSAACFLFQKQSEETMAGNPVSFEALKNIRCFEAKKIGEYFLLTDKRITNEDFDFTAYQVYEGLTAIKIMGNGFLIMYDRISGKYFYTSPFFWQINSTVQE